MKGIRRGGAIAAVLLALPMSQLGRLVAYWLQFGPQAASRQSTGAHAYFPALLQAGGAALGAALLGLLLLLAVSRFMVGLRNDRVPESGWPVGPLLLTLFVVQLAIFAGQELLEASFAGLPAAPAGHMLAWGFVGQLPVAILAAFGLSSISARVRRAVRRLRRGRLPAVVPRGASLPEPPSVPPICARPLPVLGAGFIRRGPPLSPQI